MAVGHVKCVVADSTAEYPLFLHILWFLSLYVTCAHPIIGLPDELVGWTCWNDVWASHWIIQHSSSQRLTVQGMPDALHPLRDWIEPFARKHMHWRNCTTSSIDAGKGCELLLVWWGDRVNGLGTSRCQHFATFVLQWKPWLICIPNPVGFVQQVIGFEKFLKISEPLVQYLLATPFSPIHGGWLYGANCAYVHVLFY